MTKKTKARAKGAARGNPGVKAASIDLRNLDEVVQIQPWKPVPRPAAKRVRSIGRNAILSRMEQLWNSLSQRGKAEKLRELMQLRDLAGQQLVGAQVEMGMHDKTLKGAADERHVANDWLGGYFKGPVAEIFVEGMIVAAQRSFATGLPVAMYWVESSGKLRISVAESAHQVTFLLMTPQPANTGTLTRELDRAEPLWVISGRGSQAVVDQIRPTALVTE